MKRMYLVGFMLLALCSIVLRAAHAEPNSFAKPPDNDRQAWFLDMLKTLVNAEALDDPDKVGGILGVKFNKSVTTTSASHMESFAKSFERDEYAPAAKTWFMASPPGYASTGNWRPNGGNGYAAGVDPKPAGTEVNFKYLHSKRFGLPDNEAPSVFDSVNNDSEVTIIFYGIDKLTCITLQDIQSRIPDIHHMEATDAGAERYLLSPPAREESRNVLSFAAPEGKCVTEATVYQFFSHGKREARAQYKFSQCLKKSAEAFCSQHPNASPGDFKLYDQFNAYLRKKCVSMNAFYEKERPSNQEPPKIDYSNLPANCPYHR